MPNGGRAFILLPCGRAAITASAKNGSGGIWRFGVRHCECRGGMRRPFDVELGRMKFSIRDVIWLTVVVALAVAWWLDRSSLWRANTQLERQRRNAVNDFQAWERYIGHVKDAK